MDALVINTYAGSLLVAAAQEKLNVLASLEDAGYGAGTQRLNFPGLPVVVREPWPTPGGSLRDALALAHPPCACFSIQGVNSRPENRGVRSAAFSCTRRAVSYALGLGVRALALESVPGALEGARAYHDGAARRHGYHLYRVLQNAITFGVPQWRPRYWTLYVRRDAAPARLWLVHRPTYRTVGETLEGVKPGAGLLCVDREHQRWAEKLKAVRVNLKRALARGPGSAPYLAALDLGWERKGSKSELEYAFVKAFGFTKFSSAWPVQLDPGGFAPALMATSHWWLGGRALTQPEYCALAGFPPAYRFDKPREVQAYLSRGVAPPVARWVIRQLRFHLTKGTDAAPAGAEVGRDQVAAILPGETADLRVSRRELKQRRLFNLHEEER